MDLRHYDTRAHGLEASYEDVQKGNSTPFGIARTSEFTLWPTSGVPAKAATAAMAKAGTALPMLVASPKHYHAVRAFGLWSMHDTSTPFKAAIEGAQDSWRKVVAHAAQAGIPTPAFSSSLAYYDGYRRATGPASLIQGLRDLFGAHTYQRVDREGMFHTMWGADGREVQQD